MHHQGAFADVHTRHADGWYTGRYLNVFVCERAWALLMFNVR